jgi:hypothetical protein
MDGVQPLTNTCTDAGHATSDQPANTSSDGDGNVKRYGEQHEPHPQNRPDSAGRLQRVFGRV